MSKLHIGKIISERLAEKGVSHKDIARQLNLPEPVFDLMLRNDDPGCNILFKISKILDYDFFHHYSIHLTCNDDLDNGNNKGGKKPADGEF